MGVFALVRFQPGRGCIVLAWETGQVWLLLRDNPLEQQIFAY